MDNPAYDGHFRIKHAWGTPEVKKKINTELPLTKTETFLLDSQRNQLDIKEIEYGLIGNKAKPQTKSSKELNSYDVTGLKQLEEIHYAKYPLNNEVITTGTFYNNEPCVNEKKSDSNVKDFTENPEKQYQNACQTENMSSEGKSQKSKKPKKVFSRVTKVLGKSKLFSSASKLVPSPDCKSETDSIHSVNDSTKWKKSPQKENAEKSSKESKAKPVEICNDAFIPSPSSETKIRNLTEMFAASSTKCKIPLAEEKNE